MGTRKIRTVPLKEDSLLLISILLKGFLKQPGPTWNNVLDGYRKVLERGGEAEVARWWELTHQILANIAAKEVRVSLGRRITDMERLFVTIHIENFIKANDLLGENKLGK